MFCMRRMSIQFVQGNFVRCTESLRSEEMKRINVNIALMSLAICFWCVATVPSAARAACSWSGNIGTVASPYSAADVNACVSDASSKTGDVIIQIPDATVTHSAAVTVNMRSGFTNVTSLTIRGQNDCKLTQNTSPDFYYPTTCGTNITNMVLNYTGKEGKGFRFSNMRVAGTSGIYMDGDGKSWRFDHLFWDTVTGARSARIVWITKSVATGLSEGVFDHNYFKDWAWGTAVHYQPGSDGGNYEWMTGAQLGTGHAIYFENNKFYSTNEGFYVTDNNGASRWVFRYNHITNAYFAGHDAQVGGYRGSLKFEGYNNVLSYTGSGNCYVIYRAGANGVFFNNTITGTLCSYPFSFANYRCDGAYGWPSPCSNSSKKMYLDTTAYYPQTCTGGTGCINTDGSASSPNGYPCRDQVGVSGNNPQVGGGAPFLFWNNTINGSDASSRIAVGYGSSYIMANRDYCSSAKTMPSSCNGVTTTYTPYTYPHPLTQQGGLENSTPVSTPSNLRLTR